MQCRQMNVVVENKVRPRQSSQIRSHTDDSEAQKAREKRRMLPDGYIGIRLKRGDNGLCDDADAAVIRPEARR